MPPNAPTTDIQFDDVHWYQKLLDTSHIQAHSIDVRRLRDDESEIVSGDDVAFVATAKFRLKCIPADIHKLEVREKLVTGEDILCIGPDAEVTSPLPIPHDYAQWWISQHYDFEFSLNGKSNDMFKSVGRTLYLRADESDQDDFIEDQKEFKLPWIKKLSTAQLDDDFIDVDVRVREHKEQGQQQQMLALSKGDPALSFERVVVHYTTSDGVDRTAKLAISLKVPGDGRALPKATYLLPLSSDQREGAQLQISVEDDAKR